MLRVCRLRTVFSELSFISCFVIISIYLLYKNNTADYKLSNEINLNPLVFNNIDKISKNITLLVVLDHSTDINQYSFPLKTIKCYANLHKYNLLIVKDDEFDSCQQKDPMFRRHCIAAEALRGTEWLLFLDADIAIANPIRLIEEFIDENYDLTFYDRFISWEIAMGSYLIRNTPWSQQFLYEFANYETELPNSFHGTDNGAIHAFLMTKSNISAEKKRKCLRIWSNSTGFYTLFLFELCVRNAIKSSLNKHIRIIPKGRAWVRDIWLTSSKINLERDFMVHGTKTKDRRSYPTSIFDHFRTFFNSQFDWYPFLLNNLNNEDCAYVYDERLLSSKEHIEYLLRAIHKTVEYRRSKSFSVLQKYL